MFFYNSQEADFVKWACRKNNRVFCLRSVNYFHFKNVIYQARDMGESWMSDTLEDIHDSGRSHDFQERKFGLDFRLIRHSKYN